jgi:ATP-dependent Lon protease
MAESAVIERIADIVGRRRPDLGAMIDSARQGITDQEVRDSLQLVLIDELVEFGLDADGEPTSYGLEIEGLIDAIGPPPIGRDQLRST